jgi:hypothetical protein
MMINLSCRGNCHRLRIPFFSGITQRQDLPEEGFVEEWEFFQDINCRGHFGCAEDCSGKDYLQSPGLAVAPSRV